MQITFENIVGNDEVYIDVLNALVGENRNSFLDIGCNHAPFTSKLGFKKRKYIDILPRELDDKNEQRYFEQADAIKFLNKKYEYDTTFSLDQIEHVTTDYGLEQMLLMQVYSKRQIFFTPLDGWMITDDADNNPESHRSIWKPEEISDKWIKIIFPKYHQSLGIGAWFFMNCENNEQEFIRIHNELKTKSWYGLHEVKVDGNKKLAGTLFVRNAIEFDYCIEAAVKSLQDCCDAVYVVDAGSTDDTLEVLKSLLDEKTKIIQCDKEEWDKIQGRQKLSAFTNIAIEYAEKDGYEYQFNLQADEIIHPDSIQYIQQAVALGEEGYFVTRHNLWKDENHMLNVPQKRKPCSTQICRLTKSNYRSVDDAESVNCPASLDFINKIEIFHMGFIRNPKKHIAKIKEIQQNIFNLDTYDKRADLKDYFDWEDWGFTESDLITIHKSLPIYVMEWAKSLNT